MPASSACSRNRRSFAGAGRQLQLGVAEGHDRDGERVAPLEVVVTVDAPLGDPGGSQPAGGAIREDRLERDPRVLAQVAARAAVQDEVGEGSGHDPDCRATAWIGPCTRSGRADAAHRSLGAPYTRWMAQATLYVQVGGMPFFEQLVDRFYDGVEADDVLLPLYPGPTPTSSGARRRLTLFLVQYWGGPTTYLQERGHPRLRARHFPFSIGELERDRWLVHMRAAIDASDAPADAKERLHEYMTMAADAMRNREETAPAG